MKRTVSTAHLILGIIFAGIAALWMIGQAADASIHDTAPGFPLVLIGAGVVGLVASLANSRNRKQALITHDEVDEDADTETTTVIEEN
jgi:peptidoglycan/LPS O-acetylase OafA/YrhL